MITLRKAEDRFPTRMNWLDSRHTFSFGHHFDPRHMGFSRLRVINDDTVAAGGGFGEHGHRDMEIISYVIDGGLEHTDSIGNRSVIRPGEVQLMSAGSGVRHAEYNVSATDPVHFLQIWIEPDRRGLAPGYQQKVFADAERRNRFRVVVSPDGRDESLIVHQDARVLTGTIDPGASASVDLDPARRAWVHLVRGQALLNGQPVRTGDGAAVEALDRVTIEAQAETEVLVFDLP